MSEVAVNPPEEVSAVPDASATLAAPDRQGAATPFCRPDRYRLAAGTGEGRTALTAFDRALLQAGIGDLNLVRVSSILPAGAAPADRLDLAPGSLLPVAYAAIEGNVPGSVIAAAVAVGVAADGGPGVIMEHSGPMAGAEARATVEDMVREAFENRGRPLAEITSSVAECTVGDTWAACVAAVALFSARS
jgi:arginine decarboxylase